MTRVPGEKRWVNHEFSCWTPRVMAVGERVLGESGRTRARACSVLALGWLVAMRTLWNVSWDNLYENIKGLHARGVKGQQNCLRKVRSPIEQRRRGSSIREKIEEIPFWVGSNEAKVGEREVTGAPTK